MYQSYGGDSVASGERGTDKRCGRNEESDRVKQFASCGRAQKIFPQTVGHETEPDREDPHGQVRQGREKRVLFKIIF